MLTTSTFFSSFCLISLVYFLSCFLSHLHPFIFLLPFFPFSRSFTPFSFFFPSPVSPFLFLSPPSFRISSFPFPYPTFHYFPFSPLPLSPFPLSHFSLPHHVASGRKRRQRLVEMVTGTFVFFQS